NHKRATFPTRRSAKRGPDRNRLRQIAILSEPNPAEWSSAARSVDLACHRRDLLRPDRVDLLAAEVRPWSVRASEREERGASKRLNVLTLFTFDAPPSVTKMPHARKRHRHAAPIGRRDHF